MNKPSKKTKEWITTFPGKTFSSNEQVIEFLYSFAEAIREEALETVKQALTKRACYNAKSFDICRDILQSLREPKH